MSECKRFEEEGIEQWVNGEPLDDHFESCTDCSAALAEFVTLTRAIADHSASVTAPAGWQEGVLEAVTAPAESKPIFSRWLTAAASVALLGLAFVLMRPGTPRLSFEQGVAQGEIVYRAGEQAAPGDRLMVTWEGVPKHGESLSILVYRDGREMIGDCGADGPTCSVARTGGTFSHIMILPGDYQSVVVTSSKPLPELRGKLDQDVLALRESGATRVDLLDLVTVR